MRYFLFLMALAISCHSPRPGEVKHQTAGQPIAYAHGFSVSRSDDGYLLSVNNPWEKARNIRFNYHLSAKDTNIQKNSPANGIIYTPVERVICLSSSHIAFLHILGETDKITGVSGSQYISDSLIQNGIKEGRIRDVGYGSNLNYEEILRQKPDLVLVYGVDGEISGFLEKFRDLGIPAVMVAEYLESTPLGKAEWVKFLAPFFGKTAAADSLFSDLESRYLKLYEQTRHVTVRPDVMVGLPYRDNWWVPGENSYLARLIADAGGHYLSGKESSHESHVISMEDAIQLFSGADIWINTGMITRKQDILTSDPRFGKLPFFSSARIFNNNNRFTPAGGMDFWESGTVQPDVILGDLIRIFHPGLLESDSLVYYREIR